MIESKWTGLMLLVGIFGCGDPNEANPTADSGSETDDEAGGDESTSESSSSGSSESEASSENSSTETTDTTTETTDTDTTTTTDTTDTETTTDTTTTETTDTGLLGCADVCGTPGCGDCPAPLMLAGDGYMIEATETPVGDYAAFMAIDFSPALLHPACSWKASFEPDNWGDQLAGSPNMPVTEVDWCDAEAYCRWSGRHLCGTIGGGPGVLADVSNPDTEWYAACSDGDKLLYPYGQAYQPVACNGVDFGLGTFQAVGAMASCQGGLAGLFDMSGNVREWANACASDPQILEPVQMCQRRGGGFASAVGALNCDTNSERARNDRSSTTGLRCCSDG